MGELNLEGKLMMLWPRLVKGINYSMVAYYQGLTQLTYLMIVPNPYWFSFMRQVPMLPGLYLRGSSSIAPPF
jgi:hypothetical protein